MFHTYVSLPEGNETQNECIPFNTKRDHLLSTAWGFDSDSERLIANNDRPICLLTDIAMGNGPWIERTFGTDYRSYGRWPFNYNLMNAEGPVKMVVFHSYGDSLPEDNYINIKSQSH